jgi:hypothetical protein
MPEEIAIIVPDEQTAVRELRTLRKKAEKSSKEIGNALLKWQQSLGHGKFKQAFMAAGWAESSVYYYIKQAQPDPAPMLESESIDNQKVSRITPDASREIRVRVPDSENEDSSEDEPDDMPDNPMAKQREEASKRLSSFGYGPVEVLDSDRHNGCEVIFHHISFEEIEQLIHALGETDHANIRS